MTPGKQDPNAVSQVRPAPTRDGRRTLIQEPGPAPRSLQDCQFPAPPLAPQKLTSTQQTPVQKPADFCSRDSSRPKFRSTIATALQEWTAPQTSKKSMSQQLSIHFV
jgi:hypothetical protein